MIDIIYLYERQVLKQINIFNGTKSIGPYDMKTLEIDSNIMVLNVNKSNFKFD